MPMFRIFGRKRGSNPEAEPTLIESVRRRGLSPEVKATLIHGASAMLLTQTVVPTPIEDEKGNINRQALGYIFGFVEAAILHLGGDTHDAFVGAPIVLEILKRMYPGHERRYLDFIVLNLETDQAMYDGARYGGQQFQDYVVHNHPSGGHAMGLARCLLGEAVGKYLKG
jgi:hypothetical protein